MNNAKKIKVAVIQLTRIGDIIQTAQAVRQLKAEKDNIEVTLIARRKFASGLQFLLDTIFDQTVYFDTADFFAKKNFKDAQVRVHNFINDIQKNEFDLVINLSYSKSSSYLTSLLKAKYHMGLMRNTRNEISINDKWSQYIYSTVMSSTNNPFSLVDIYRHILGAQQPHKLIGDDETRENTIVIHPFASDRKKRWGISKWVELIYKMSKEHPGYNFSIVGGKEDLVEAERIAHSPALSIIANRINIHVGDFSIADTYQQLMNSKLFIGHDSMVSHLASETLTPSIIISLGTVRPNETTPYGENIINVSPKNSCFPCTVQTSCELLPCHNSINFQVIASVAKGLLAKEEITKDYLKQNVQAFMLDTVRIYRSEFSEDGLELNEVSDNYKTTSDVFKQYYKIIWQYYLRGVETNASLPEITTATAQELNKYIDGTNYLYELYNFGVKYSNRLITECESTHPNSEIIKENISKLAEVDELCAITKKSYPLLKDIVDYFYVNKANAMGDNIIDIAKHNLLTYYDASNLVAVLNDFIDKSVKPHINIRESNKEV